MEEGFIKSFNKGLETAYLGTAEDGVGLLGLHNGDGKQIVYLGSGDEGSGLLQTYNHKGVKNIYVGSESKRRIFSIIQWEEGKPHI